MKRRIEVAQDKRVHDRVFPPPPLAECIDLLPHDWLTTFEDMAQWRIVVEGVDDPEVLRCRHRPLFHEHHVEIKWSKIEDGRIILLPPHPLDLPASWDAIDFWVAGIPDNWRVPAMECLFRIRDANGSEHSLDMGIRRPQAIDMFHRLVPRAIREALQGGSLEGIEFRIPEAGGDSMLQLHALTFYTFRPRRTYRRPERLPFPTHPDGVVPTPKSEGKNEVDHDGARQAATSFNYVADEGTSITYCYEPETGTLADISVSVGGGEWFRPCDGGGLVWSIDGNFLEPPDSAGQARLMNQRCDGDRLESHWEVQLESRTIRYRLVLRPVHRSLVIEVEVEGTDAVELRIGYPDLDTDMRAIEVPMLTWDFWKPKKTDEDWDVKRSNDYDPPEAIGRKGGRARSPAVLIAGDCFLSAVFDWYNSDASFLYATAEEPHLPAGYDGGAFYLPVIDEGRNPLKEKLILTISEDFQEVLPNIPNPPSPYVELMRDRVYSHGSSPLISAKRHENLGIHAVATLLQSYSAVADRGGYRHSLDAGCMDEWIDDPGRSNGGIDRILAKASDLRRIGWLIGTYVNYCMTNAVFRNYAELPKLHDIDGFHRSTWPGTVIPATGEAISYMRRQAAKIRAQCGVQLAYDDQRTILPIWRFNDYTPGVPGAGKFRETFEQGALLYTERGNAYDGPILSEGGLHWMYSGMVDGNIARKQHLSGEDGQYSSKTPSKSDPYTAPPDLVDFQLQKIHLLTVDNCSNNYFDSWDPDLRDRFIAETLAYGKGGLWCSYHGKSQETQAMSCRTYYTFHLAQKRYRCVAPQEILYHDGKELIDTSTLLKRGKEGVGHVYTRYENGFESWVNLNPEESWAVEVDGRVWRLPPYGWFQRRQEDWGCFLNYRTVEPDEPRRARIDDKQVVVVSTAGHLARWDDLEADGTVVICRETAGSVRIVNVDALTIRINAKRWRPRSSTAPVAYHRFDLEGDALDLGTIEAEDGWLDFSFLAQEQFARVMP